MLGPWMTRNPVSSSDDVKHSLFHNNKILSMSVFNSSDVQRVIGAYPICCWLHMKEMITTQQRSHPTLSINTDPAWESPGSAVLGSQFDLLWAYISQLKFTGDNNRGN